MVQKTNLCLVCEGILTGRQKKYCSSNCSKQEGRRTYLLKTYSISLEDYNTIFDFQNGACALCNKPPKAGQTLHVDHSHEEGQSGQVLGLLCYRDNKFLKGKLKKQDILDLYNYVMNPPAVQALGRVVIAPGKAPKKRTPRKRKRNGS